MQVSTEEEIERLLPAGWPKRGLLIFPEAGRAPYLKAFQSARKKIEIAAYRLSDMDGSYIRPHPHSAGAQGKGDPAISLSRGVKTTKIHLVVDSFGLPIHFEITGGQIHDCTQASDFLENMPTTQYIIADKGYGSEPLRQIILAKDSTPVIHRKSNSKIGNDDMDWGLY